MATSTSGAPHDHEWATWIQIDRAPIDPADPVAHTSFFVLACRACRVATVFPAVNFFLTTRAYRDALAAELRADGLTLVPVVEKE